MTLYEIDRAIMDAITAGLDPETGELTNYDELEELQLARDEKIENIACYIKNIAADAKAIRDEEQALAKRRKTLENRAEGLKKYLSDALNGEKFSSPRAVISWRKSSKVVPGDGFVEWARDYRADLLTYKAPEPSLTAIRDAFKAGETLKYVDLVETNSIQVK